MSFSPCRTIVLLKWKNILIWNTTWPSQWCSTSSGYLKKTGPHHHNQAVFNFLELLFLFAETLYPCYLWLFLGFTFCSWSLWRWNRVSSKWRCFPFLSFGHVWQCNLSFCLKILFLNRVCRTWALEDGTITFFKNSKWPQALQIAVGRLGSKLADFRTKSGMKSPLSFLEDWVPRSTNEADFVDVCL
jgi:hypothetical protein